MTSPVRTSAPGRGSAQGGPPGRAGQNDRVVFGHQAQRPGQRADERGTLVVWALRTNRAAWISSLSTTKQPSPRACGLAATVTAARRLAGPSGTGQGGVAHRAGEHDRHLAGVQQVGQERRLLDRVGALADHHPVRARRGLGPDRAHQVQHVVDGEGRAGHLPEIVHLEGDARPVQARDGSHQVSPGQLRPDSDVIRRAGVVVLAIVPPSVNSATFMPHASGRENH